MIESFVYLIFCVSLDVRLPEQSTHFLIYPRQGQVGEFLYGDVAAYEIDDRYKPLSSPKNVKFDDLDSRKFYLSGMCIILC